MFLSFLLLKTKNSSMQHREEEIYKVLSLEHPSLHSFKGGEVSPSHSPDVESDKQMIQARKLVKLLRESCVEAQEYRDILWFSVLNGIEADLHKLVEERKMEAEHLNAFILVKNLVIEKAVEQGVVIPGTNVRTLTKEEMPSHTQSLSSEHNHNHSHPCVQGCCEKK